MADQQLVLDITSNGSTGTFYVEAPGAHYNVKGWRAHLSASVLEGTGETLDVTIQDTVDEQTWADVKSFAQMTTASHAPERIAWAVYDGTPVYTAARLRVKYVIGTDGTAATFQVVLEAIA
jgi:hypothetical protein